MFTSDCLLVFETTCVKIQFRRVRRLKEHRKNRADILPALDVAFEFAAGESFSAVVGEGAGYGQFVQQLVHKHAGFPAALQHQGRTADGAEVTLQQEAGETFLAVGVPAGCVQGTDERLQTNVTDEVLIHLVCVQVLMVLLQLVTVAAAGAQIGRWRQKSVV